ncbi:hypothetical protein BDR07DRAFT_480952 [Suillus spraguei]|nr:hypothetical protein BDR07DRAFT_480952 [Suillus spraguei]
MMATLSNNPNGLLVVPLYDLIDYHRPMEGMGFLILKGHQSTFFWQGLHTLWAKRHLLRSTSGPTLATAAATKLQLGFSCDCDTTGMSRTLGLPGRLVLPHSSWSSNNCYYDGLLRLDNRLPHVPSSRVLKKFSSRSLSLTLIISLACVPVSFSASYFARATNQITAFFVGTSLRRPILSIELKFVAG